MCWKRISAFWSKGCKFTLFLIPALPFRERVREAYYQYNFQLWVNLTNAST